MQLTSVVLRQLPPPWKAWKPVRYPATFWSRRAHLRLSSHYTDRRNNNFRLAFRNILRANNFSRLGTIYHSEAINGLKRKRIAAAANELGVEYIYFRRQLKEAAILLNIDMLQILAQHEPRTFRSLVSIVKGMNRDPLINFEFGPPSSLAVPNVIISKMQPELDSEVD